MMMRLFRSRIWKFLLLPLLVTVGTLFVSAAGGFLPAWVCMPCGILYLLGLLFLLVSSIVWFARKNWKFGLAAIGCLVLSLLALAPAFTIAFISGIAAEDHFADDLELPEGIELAEPEDRYRAVDESESNAGDSFQDALLQSLEMPGTDDPTVMASVPALATLHRDHPALLRHYLAVHPAWWFHVHRGKEFATRRWMIDGHWKTRLHGYFSSFSSSGGHRYQTRTCLGLSGKAWSWNVDEIEAGVATKLSLSRGNTMHESYVYWREGGMTVELFEQAETEERRMTKAAIAELQAEFEALLENPAWEHARTQLPEGTITRGERSFRLLGGSQPGIYVADIRCNPGEPGRLYLKAYEITQDTPLSESRLKGRTTEFVGWSEDPEEMFQSSFQFTIYEGNWGQYYGARFEVWFSPENGGADRKLMESNWKIEGWMH